MGFEKIESAKLYTATDGDTLQAVAERETAAGNPITWQELAKYNWGTDDPATINELLRDELGARKRDGANNFVISADDSPRSDLRIPKKFQKAGLPLEKTHILRVKKKTIAPQFQACSSIPAATFETGKSFLRPSVADDMQAVENAILENPDAKIMIFGHTDKVGSERDNKALSERRAKSVFAFITDDADTWEELYKEENWGTKAIQEILKDFDDPSFDPGPVDGIYGQKTQEAVRNYQKARGLSVDGVAGPQTRKKLFSDYMTGKHDVKVTPDQFMEPKYMGCGEFNPVDNTEDAVEVNRRVVIFLFHPDRLPNLPCGAGDVGSCTHQSVAGQPRHHEGFRCSFYDSLACRCPAEGRKYPTEVVEIQVLRVFIPGHVPPYTVQGEGLEMFAGEEDRDRIIVVDYASNKPNPEITFPHLYGYMRLVGTYTGERMTLPAWERSILREGEASEGDALRGTFPVFRAIDWSFEDTCYDDPSIEDLLASNPSIPRTLEVRA